MNNGYTTQRIKVERGVPQGCLLSPFIFILAIEFLGIAIRENKNIQGIKIENINYKVVMFADDTTVITKDDEDLQKMWETLENFLKVTERA